MTPQELVVQRLMTGCDGVPPRPNRNGATASLRALVGILEWLASKNALAFLTFKEH